MLKRNLYLNNVPVEEALEKFLAALELAANASSVLATPVTLETNIESYSVNKYSYRSEIIPAAEALDRVTAHAVFARYCSPLFNAAAMDGIAVVTAATANASETNPVSLIKGRDFITVDTGDPVKQPFDAVIMAEDIQEVDENTVLIRSAIARWQHIRPIGEDIVTGEMILTGKHRIRPIDIGVLLSAGITEIEVFQKPKVAIFPTGNEIIEPDQIPGEGQIIESNTRMLDALVREGGGEGKRFAVIPDDPIRLENAIKTALDEYDMVLVNAGSSAGTEDHTPAVLQKLGKVIVHGVAMKPGKPVILAVADNKPVIGIPGYPVSAYLAYKNFAAPVLAKLTCREEPTPAVIEAVLSKRLVSSLKHREYVRVKVGNVNGKLVASPLARGAGAAMSLVRADGFCVIPQNSEGIEAGQTAPVQLIRPLQELERTLVCVGSHDLILDLIADIISFQSTHVGSLAGLAALKRGECHIAPIHLMEEETGIYNIPFLQKFFPDTPVCLVKGVGRTQGLIVRQGNPLGIKSPADLASCRFVNRQRGSGTRLFLDFKLKQEGINSESITGYDREAVTHMAVAAAVKSGDADAGIGIASAAAALGLDFIPLGKEDYDFAVFPCFLELPQFKSFIEILKSQTFHQQLDKLGGYTTDHSGEIINL